MEESNTHLVINMDDGYFMPTVVMLTSVFANNPRRHFTVHVLSAGLTMGVRKRLEYFAGERYGQTVVFHDIGADATNKFPEYVNSHISMAANYRLFVADILPADVHRALYLDCDLIVDSPLDDLLDTDISHYAVAAVEDMWSGKADNYERLGYDRADGYFNSGVLLINLDMWRTLALSKDFVAFLETHDNLKFVDQDILNGVLHASWLHLHFRWNVQDGFLRRKPKIRREMMTELLLECGHPAIIHFTGGRKPWRYDCQNPLRYRFFHYLDMVGSLGTRPELPAKFRRKLLLDRVLYALRLKPRKYRKSLTGI